MKVYLLYMHDDYERTDELKGIYLSPEDAKKEESFHQYNKYPDINDYHHGFIHFSTQEMEVSCGDSILIPLIKEQWEIIHTWLANGTSMCMNPAAETFDALSRIEEVFPEWES